MHISPNKLMYNEDDQKRQPLTELQANTNRPLFPHKKEDYPWERGLNFPLEANTTRAIIGINTLKIVP